MQGASQPVFRQHSNDGLLQKTCGFFLANFLCRSGLDSARISAVVIIDFIIPLFTGQSYLGGIDDDYVIDGFPNCDGYPTTAPIGAISEGASWVGALDLSGNVWEWVADYYDQDYYNPLRQMAVEPQGPAHGEAHVLRGGAWSIDEADHLLASFRGWYEPGIMGDFILIGKHVGFRCAQSFSVKR